MTPDALAKLLPSDPFRLAEMRAALAAAGTGTWRWDATTGEVRWDAAMEALSGLEPGTFGSTYEAWLATLHPDELDTILAMVHDAITRRSSYHFEHRTVWPDGSVRWLECRGQVTTDPDGTFTGTVGCAIDITERRRIEDERAEMLARERQLRDRFEFLVELTDSALATTDHRQFMRSAAQAAVPRLGDWCTIRFVPDRGAEHELVITHSDPAMVERVRTLVDGIPYDPDRSTGVPKVIRTGRTDFIERVTAPVIDAALAEVDVDVSELRAVLRDLAPTSVITAPLTTKRGVLGAMQFVSAESGRVYDRDDIALAEIVASRVADALDNMWLTTQQRQIASVLQRALLPPALPEIPGVEVAVRYWPAGAAVEAGGDFYDLFRTGPTEWSVLIGDVCGTGPDAAALTSIARHTVRAAARHGLGHREVLDWLNEALLLSDRHLFCTAVYATLEGSDGSWAFSHSAAGHPLPVLVPRAGPARLVGEHGTLAGVLDELTVSITTTTLDVGDVIVLYTDGITDLPPPNTLTEDDVVEMAVAAASLESASTAADAIHRAVTGRLSGEERADDIALVVLRVTGPPPTGP